MKIPDTNAAKKMTLAGKERAAQDAIERIALQKEAAKHQRKLERAWNLQTRKLVNASIDQKSSVTLPSIVFPKRLIDLDIEILEIGDITDHYFKSQSRVEIIEQLRKLIPTFSAQAPESALRIWSYWEDMDKELECEIEKFLNRAKTSKFEDGEFLSYLGRNSRFKRLPLSRFDAVLQKIQDAMASVKEIMQISNWTSFKFIEVDLLLNKKSDGRYFFSRTDEFKDELQVAVVGNQFEISWVDGASSYFNLPKNLVSADGLAWLVQEDGQRLCRALGMRISQRADEGRSSLNLFLDANLLSDEDGFVATCPSEIFFTELISTLGYKTKKNKALDKVVELEVRW